MFRKLTQTYSFEQLYKKNYAPLYYYAFRFITDEEVCKDIVNDVFEKAWQNFGKMNPETASAYLYAQVRNRCIDHLRHQQVEEQYAQQTAKQVEALLSLSNYTVESVHCTLEPEVMLTIQLSHCTNADLLKVQTSMSGYFGLLPSQVQVVAIERSANT